MDQEDSMEDIAPPISLNHPSLSYPIMNHDDPSDPLTPPSTPFQSTAPSDPRTIPAIQLPKESPLITCMAAALSDNMNDLQIPASAYPKNAWIIADDCDLPSLTGEILPCSKTLPLSETVESTTEGSDKDMVSDKDTASDGSTSNVSEDTTEFSWSDAHSEDDEEDHFELPPRPWEGIPTAIVVLFFAFMFAQSVGLWTGRIRPW